MRQISIVVQYIVSPFQATLAGCLSPNPGHGVLTIRSSMLLEPGLLDVFRAVHYHDAMKPSLPTHLEQQRHFHDDEVMPLDVLVTTARHQQLLDGRMDDGLQFSPKSR
jgi:hypothetical protein